MNLFGRILPKRHNVIISKNLNINVQNEESVEIINDISMLDKYIKDQNENFVIGGANIYKLLIPYCNKMYITEIYQEFDGDAFFPEIDMNIWKIVNREKGIKDEKNPFDYEYVDYEKK